MNSSTSEALSRLFASASVWVLGASLGLSSRRLPAQPSLGSLSTSEGQKLQSRMKLQHPELSHLRRQKRDPGWHLMGIAPSGILLAKVPLTCLLASRTGLERTSALPPVGTQWEESCSSAE